MIKINLLSEGRRPVVARKAKAKLTIGDQDPGNLILGAGLVLAILISVGWWYRLNAKMSDINKEVRRAQIEYDQLAPVIAEVEDFKRKRTELEEKVEVIMELKRQRKGPVTIMDNISRALPDLLWLEQLSIIGETVSLKGKAFNTNAVATFIENLERVPEFLEPDTRNVSQDANASSYSFQLSFRFINIQPEEEEAAGEGAAG